MHLLKNRTVLSIILVLFFIFTLKDHSSKPPVKIGVVLPLSGDYKIFGKRGLQGIKMAVHDINEAGGVLDGRSLELEIEDNKTDPGLSVRKIRKLIQENDVLSVIGPVSSAARNAMSEVAEELRTPLLYGIDYEGGIYNRYLFCYSPIPDHYVKPLISYLMNLNRKSFFIFGYDYIWPHKIADAVKNEVIKQGGKVAGIEFTPFGKKNFAKPLNRIKESGADTLILALPGMDGFNFIKEFHSSGLKKHIKMVALAAEESYLKNLTAEELEGIISVLQFIESLDKTEAQSFVARQKKMFGEKSIVTYSSESHYGLVLLLKEAIEKAGSLDKEQIIDAMVGIEIIVGNGKVKMREDHNMNLNMIIAEFTKGQLIAKKDIGLVIPSDQRQKANRDQ